MSGKERLDAHVGSAGGRLVRRVLVVVALAAFIVLGLALEAGWTP